jgi:predicted nucleotidyltransferase
MDTDLVIATLKAYETDLRRKGVSRVAVFGSVARGEAGPGRDLDIMVEVEPDARLDVDGYVGITQFISELFQASVDVADRVALRPSVRQTADPDAVYAF